VAACMSRVVTVIKFRVTRGQPPLRLGIGIQKVLRRKGMQGSMPFLFVCFLLLYVRRQCAEIVNTRSLYRDPT